jgi:hypothetical protein
MALSLQKRVELLESQVAELQDQFRTSSRGRNKDWRSAIEKYAGDEDLQSVFAEAMKLREAERKRVRQGRRNSRGKQG